MGLWAFQRAQHHKWDDGSSASSGQEVPLVTVAELGARARPDLGAPAVGGKIYGGFSSHGEPQSYGWFIARND